MPPGINCALLLAAGSGARMQGTVKDKILTPIDGKPVFSFSLKAFADCDAINTIAIVYRDEVQREQLAAILDPRIQQKIVWVKGGDTRQHSVLNGLLALPADAAHTLIHDCARPLVSTDLILKLIETAWTDGAACPAHPLADTVKRIPRAGELRQVELEDLERDRLWAMQTPQAFRHKEILKAYQHVAGENLRITDDCAAAASIGLKTTLIPNPDPNPKITTRADLDFIAWLLDQKP